MKSFIILFAYLTRLSSPYLIVFGDDCVTCYTGANDVSGGGVVM